MTEAEYKRRHAAAGNGLDPGVQVPPTEPVITITLVAPGDEVIAVWIDPDTVPDGWTKAEWWTVYWKPDFVGGRFIDYRWERVNADAVTEYQSIGIGGEEGWYYVVGTDNAGKYVTAKSNVIRISHRDRPPDARFFEP